MICCKPRNLQSFIWSHNLLNGAASSSKGRNPTYLTLAMAGMLQFVSSILLATAIMHPGWSLCGLSHPASFLCSLELVSFSECGVFTKNSTCFRPVKWLHTCPSRFWIARQLTMYNFQLQIGSVSWKHILGWSQEHTLRGMLQPKSVGVPSHCNWKFSRLRDKYWITAYTQYVSLWWKPYLNHPHLRIVALSTR